MLANVRQVTSKPLIRSTVLSGALVYADEYGLYVWLKEWGCGHKMMHHGAAGE